MSREVHPSAVLRGHQGDVQCLAFDHFETHLFSGDAQGEVRVWDLTDLRPHTISRLHPASAGVINLKLWHTPSTAAPLLVSQGRDGITHVWKLEEGMKLPKCSPLRTFAKDAFSFCRFSLLAVETVPVNPGSGDGRSEAQNFVEAVLSDNSKNAAAAAATDGHTLNSPPSLSAIENAIHAVHTCIEEDPSLPPALLAIPGDSEKEIELCCVGCGESLAIFKQDPSVEEPDRWGMCMAAKLFVGPESRQVLLAVGYESGHVLIWQVWGKDSTGKKENTHPLAQGKLHSEPIMALDIDSNGLSGVSASAEDKLISFRIDLEGGVVVPTASIDVRKEGVADVALRQDGKLILSAGWDGKIRVYKRSNGKALAVLKYHSESASAVAFSPQTHRIASGARDGTIALWDVYAKT